MSKGMKLLITVFMIFIFMNISNANQAGAGFSLSIGTGNFYFSVGGHDYCNYDDDYFYGGPVPPYQANISFYSILNDYGYWAYYGGLGNVWVPRVAYDWRPYSHGHWIYTAYGWNWVSYEPWGWIPHHYGNWLFTSHYGWVWIPGYAYHPARVRWITCGGYMGWAPIAPYGYAHYRGPWRGRYGFYNRPIYVNNTYINNYVFINNRYFMVDNVYRYNSSHGNIGDVFTAGYYNVAEMSKGPDRYTMERNIRKKIEVRDMEIRHMDINGRKVVYHRPQGEIENIRRNAHATVERAIAPGFEEAKMRFKGTRSRSNSAINKLFGQENRAVDTRTFESTATSRGKADEKRTVSTSRSGSVAQTATGKSNYLSRSDSFRKAESSAGDTARSGYASKTKNTSGTMTSGKKKTSYTGQSKRSAGFGSSSSTQVTQASKRSSNYSHRAGASNYGKNVKTSGESKAGQGSMTRSPSSNVRHKGTTSKGKHVASGSKAGKHASVRPGGSRQTSSKAKGKSGITRGDAKGKAVVSAPKEGTARKVTGKKQMKEKK